MCGRTAQTTAVVHRAAKVLGMEPPPLPPAEHESSSNGRGAAGDNLDHAHSSSSNFDALYKDNYNLSPGMDAVVFWMDHSSRKLQMKRKVWGLVPKSGTKNHPLPTGMNQHFANLMYNARSDTLFDKPTFARLAADKKSCIVALDGFFEWKTELGQKKPFFVTRATEKASGSNSCPSFLLMAGLWTSVATGRPDDPMLDTFTVLTTEVCSSLAWLHTRMPVCVWDMDTAKQWLEAPTKVFRTLQTQANALEEFRWHAVTPRMSSVKFRSSDAVKALPKLKTVDSFFKKAAASNASSGATSTRTDSSKKKRSLESASSPAASPASTLAAKPPSKKTKPTPKVKKGSIMNFFSPKAKG